MTEEHRSDGRSIDEILAEARAELDKTPDEPQQAAEPGTPEPRTILRRISATRSMTTANSRSRSPRRSFLRSRPASATSALCRCS